MLSRQTVGLLLMGSAVAFVAGAGAMRLMQHPGSRGRELAVGVAPNSTRAGPDLIGSMDRLTDSVSKLEARLAEFERRGDRFRREDRAILDKLVTELPQEILEASAQAASPMGSGAGQRAGVGRKWGAGPARPESDISRLYDRELPDVEEEHRLLSRASVYRLYGVPDRVTTHRGQTTWTFSDRERSSYIKFVFIDGLVADVRLKP